MSDEAFFANLYYVICVGSFFLTAGLFTVLRWLGKRMDQRSANLLQSQATRR